MLSRAPGCIEIEVPACQLRRRVISNWLAQRRTRARGKKKLALYRTVLPTEPVEAALEAEGLLPRYPAVGREHVHKPEAVEAALTAYILKKLCQR